jgi:hypothetical protein
MASVGLSIVQRVLGEESGMDETLIPMPVPALPPTAQPRANSTRPFNAVAGKSMRIAHAKAIVLAIPVSNFFQRMSPEWKAVYDARQKVKCAKAPDRCERLQTGERKQEQLARAKGPGRLVTRPCKLIQSLNCWTRNQGNCAVQPRYRCHDFACLTICGS